MVKMFQASTKKCGLHAITLGGAGQTDSAGGAWPKLSHGHHGHLPRYTGTVTQQKYISVTNLMDEVDQCDVNDFQETINLANPQYAKVFQPILPGCTCYTCKNFSSAYIHHLIVVKEMQCYVLLMLHNLHHHLSFFKEAKHCFRSASDLGWLRTKIVELNKN